jgi:rhodanese-related sulfurtransferase
LQWMENIIKLSIHHPQTVLLDVRTPGEFADTSYKTNLNIGHLKNAMNAPIDEMEGKVKELQKDSSKTYILYCSHSQRSRRFGRFLHDKGFKNVYNLNGGMTWMNLATEKEFPGKNELIIHNVPFHAVGGSEVATLLKKNKDITIIDVRSASLYEGKDSIEANNIGRLKRAINFPLDIDKLHLEKLKADKAKPVFVYDMSGASAFVAGKFLSDHGYKNVYVLTGGLQALLGKHIATAELRKEIMENTPAYHFINSKEALDMFSKNAFTFIADVRTEAEYNNQAKEIWRRQGRFKGSVNVAPDKVDAKVKELAIAKGAGIFVYGNAQTASKFCKLLSDAGYINVYFLNGGLWEMIYLYSNVPGFEKVKDYMENNEGLY